MGWETVDPAAMEVRFGGDGAGFEESFDSYYSYCDYFGCGDGYGFENGGGGGYGDGVAGGSDGDGYGGGM